MPDHMTPEQRHRNMAAIRARDTKPEIIVRKFLWSHGFRYRLNHKRLPGKPDIVLRRYRTCIFVNGCFWHGHGVTFGEGAMMVPGSSGAAGLREIRNSACCKIPRSNTEFWVRKIARNQVRDLEVKRKLSRMGWHSITIWECELKPGRRDATLESLLYTLSKIFLQDHGARTYVLPEEDAPKMVADESVPEYGEH